MEAAGAARGTPWFFVGVLCRLVHSGVFHGLDRGERAPTTSVLDLLDVLTEKNFNLSIA